MRDRLRTGTAPGKLDSIALILLLAVCANTTHCGRKAPPRPPEDVVPKAIGDLTATSVATGIQLSWTRPRTYADGARMTDLGGFVIERADAAGPHVTFKRLGEIEVNDRDRFRQMGRFRYVDEDTIMGNGYLYRVVSFTVDRYFSEPSKIVAAERTAVDEGKHAPLPATQR